MRISVDTPVFVSKETEQETEDRIAKATTFLQSALAENYSPLLNSAIFGIGNSRAEILNVIEELLNKASIEIQGKTTRDIAWDAYKYLVGYSVIHELILDQEITEICVNGPNQVTYKKHGKRFLAKKVKFKDLTHLEKVADRILVGSHTEANEGRPMVDNCWLDDGSRCVINKKAVVPSHGLTINIRKFRDKNFTFEELEKLKTLTSGVYTGEETTISDTAIEAPSTEERKSRQYSQSEFLEDMAQAGATVAVSGGTHTGKTTMIRTLAGLLRNLIPPPPEDPDQDPEIGLRIITIENMPELQLLKYYPELEVVEMLERDSKYNPITVEGIYPQVMRMDPDVILVGEMRFPIEAAQTIRAMRSGHDNTMGSIHTDDAKACVQEIRTKMQSLSNVSDQIANVEISTALDLVVQLNSIGGKIQVTQIAEVNLDENKEINIHNIFLRRGDGVMIYQPITQTLARRLLFKGRTSVDLLRKWL